MPALNFARQRIDITHISKTFQIYSAVLLKGEAFSGWMTQAN